MMAIADCLDAQSSSIWFNDLDWTHEWTYRDEFVVETGVPGNQEAAIGCPHYVT